MVRELEDLGIRDRTLALVRRFKRQVGGHSYWGRSGVVSRFIQKLRDWPDPESLPPLDKEDESILEEITIDPSTGRVMGEPGYGWKGDYRSPLSSREERFY